MLWAKWMVVPHSAFALVYLQLFVPRLLPIVQMARGQIAKQIVPVPCIQMSCGVTTWLHLFIMVVKYLLYYLTSPPSFILSVWPPSILRSRSQNRVLWSLYHLLSPPPTDLLRRQTCMNRILYKLKYVAVHRTRSFT